MSLDIKTEVRVLADGTSVSLTGTELDIEREFYAKNSEAIIRKQVAMDAERKETREDIKDAAKLAVLAGGAAVLASGASSVGQTLSASDGIENTKRSLGALVDLIGSFRDSPTVKPTSPSL